MSSRRRLKGSRAERPRCGSCGRTAGAGAVTLRDGRKICPRCRDAGVLMQRLACGHMGVPGMLVITDNGEFQCAQCSPYSTHPARKR